MHGPLAFFLKAVEDGKKKEEKEGYSRDQNRNTLFISGHSLRNMFKFVFCTFCAICKSLQAEINGRIALPGFKYRENVKRH